MKSVAEILKEIRPEFDFTASTDFMADGMLDSFDMITLVAALDKNFGISIQGTDIVPEHFQNLQTIEALLRKTGGGLLVDPDSTTSLAEGIFSLWKDRALLEERGRCGAAGVREHYSVARMAARALDVYSGVAAARVHA